MKKPICTAMAFGQCTQRRRRMPSIGQVLVIGFVIVSPVAYYTSAVIRWRDMRKAGLSTRLSDYGDPEAPSLPGHEGERR
jgi:hypothetical protein